MKRIINRTKLNEKNDIKEKHFLYNGNEILNKAVYLDLEHYIYKVPVCLGIFGASRIEGDEIVSTQYFLEGKEDLKVLVNNAYLYLINCLNNGYKYMVTFAGNNDRLVLNAMFRKYNLVMDFNKEFYNVDIQREIEKAFESKTGLKATETILNIDRTDDITGSNIAKTFSNIMKDKDYINRMPQSKVNKLLIYNQQDCENLYHILNHWGELSKEKFTEFNKLKQAEKELSNVNNTESTKSKNIKISDK